MPRNIKNPVERRNEFIAVAEELFVKNGFENTSIDDIVIRMNVAKGLFYHYFDSKDELLTAIAERLLDEIRSSIVLAMEKKGLTALERLRELIPSNVDISDRSKMVVALFQKERNQAFYHLMEERACEYFVPAVESIVKQGIEEGIFHTDYPTETTIAWVAMVRGLRKGMPPEASPEQISRMAAASQEISERMLGAKPGTLEGILANPFFGTMSKDRHIIEKNAGC